MGSLHHSRYVKIHHSCRYHLGRNDTSENRNLETVSLASIYKQHFSCEVNSRNLCLLLQTYMHRSDINLAREINATNGKPLFGATRTLKVPVLNMTGDRSPHVDATVAFNGRLQPNKCTWMKIQDCAMVLEEQPGKVAEAVKLFVQGLGYIFKPKKSQSATSTPMRTARSAQAQAQVGSESTVTSPEAEVATEEMVKTANDVIRGLEALTATTTAAEDGISNKNANEPIEVNLM